MTQSEAAAVAGMSRQNFWDKLNNRNPRFNTMTRILDAFGYQIHVVRKDGETLNFCEADFFATAEKEVLKKQLSFLQNLDILQAKPEMYTQSQAVLKRYLLYSFVMNC